MHRMRLWLGWIGATACRRLVMLLVPLAGIATPASAGEPWETTGANGVRVLGQMIGNRYVGNLAAKGPNGALLLAVSFDREGLATKVELPSARLEPARPEPGNAPVTGAFGIQFGTASLPELAVTCAGSGEHCLTRLAYGMVHDSLGPDDIAWDSSRSGACTQANTRGPVLPRDRPLGPWRY